MAYEPKNFDHLIGKVKGLSETQLKAHFTLYQGYVKKLNEISDKLKSADRGAPNYSFNDYSELRRREPVAYNGTILHELYFGNLGADGTGPSAELTKAIESAFGNADAWAADMKACAGSAHGWVLTTWDGNYGCIRNNLVQSEHHVGLLANNHVIYALDVWEHAYFFDYQTKKADYVANVLQAVNWKAVNDRYAAASGKK
ncbi:MAG: hypothetical protein HYY93_03850 [Planctomycetes bacterium]|nr:hypothetical protein [Planctomycetota bacterium]